MSKLKTVAIVGRTNVGKSTLFNLIAGKRLSIVADTPGVTRDRNYTLIQRPDVNFMLIDTGGFLAEEYDHLYDSVKKQTIFAIEEADCIVAVVDGISGLHPYDKELAQTLRQQEKKVIWIINKCEKPSTVEQAVEFHALGIDEYFCISAAHNQRVDEVLRQIKKVLGNTEDDSSKIDSLKVAILGKPNVGKSTLVNRLIGENRVITSDHAGTTRDRIYLPLQYEEEELLLVDTAGLRKKRKVKDESIERYSTLRTLRELATCDVAVLMLDATQGPPSDQDINIGALIHERGRCLIIAVNKWDAVEKDHKSAKKFKDEVYEQFKFAKYAPVLFISAQTGRRCTNVLKKALQVYKNSQFRIQTSDLNKTLERIFIKNPPPVHRGQPVKLFFATQIGISPPTIVLFLNLPTKISAPYQRYIIRNLREAYPFEGVAIKISLRKKRSSDKVSDDSESANSAS